MSDKKRILYCKYEGCGKEFMGTRQARYCFEHVRQLMRESAARGHKNRGIKVDRKRDIHPLERCNLKCKTWDECKIAMWKPGVLPCMPKMELLGDFRKETAPSGLKSNFPSGL